MRILLIVGAVIAAIGLFLLASASADTTLFARHYPWLLALNAALATLLAILVVVQLIVLARRYRARQFGTRLTLRLLARFALLAVVPGMIVYAVSVQFLARSIESWFDVKVDAAGTHAYVSNYNSNTIIVYNIDQSTGTLTSAQTTSGSNGMDGPDKIGMDPDGEYLYVNNVESNQVSVYAISAGDGQLTLMDHYRTRSGARGTVLKTGTPSRSCPPLPGATPATICVP